MVKHDLYRVKYFSQ